MENNHRNNLLKDFAYWLNENFDTDILNAYSCKNTGKIFYTDSDLGNLVELFQTARENLDNDAVPFSY